MLSFLTNALMTSTQRYISFYQGRGNSNDVTKVFSNSLILHFVIGILLIGVLEIVYPFLFDGFLNISMDRVAAAKIIYQLVLVMLFLSLLAAPFKALLISHENIVYISVIEVCDGILKLASAFLLSIIPYDNLIAYGGFMLMIGIFNFTAFSLYAKLKYTECKLLQVKLLDLQYIREIFTFTQYIVYHSLCIVGRTQGIALVINKFYNATVNAAYGIGMQISGAVNFVSSSLGNAINPQLIKSEGANNREHMWHLARMQCKYSFLLLAAVSIPIMFEIDFLLDLWLKKVPEYSAFFAIMILSAALVNQLTDGLGAAKHAMGDIKKYTLIVSTPKLLVIPISVLCLYCGASIYSIAVAYICTETFSAFIRLPILKSQNSFDLSKYFNQVIKKVIIPISLNIIVSIVCVNYIDIQYRFILTFALSITTICISAYVFAMNKEERQFIKNTIRQISNKCFKR